MPESALKSVVTRQRQLQAQKRRRSLPRLQVDGDEAKPEAGFSKFAKHEQNRVLKLICETKMAVMRSVRATRTAPTTAARSSSL